MSHGVEAGVGKVVRLKRIRVHVCKACTVELRTRLLVVVFCFRTTTFSIDLTCDALIQNLLCEAVPRL